MNHKPNNNNEHAYDGARDSFTHVRVNLLSLAHRGRVLDGGVWGLHPAPLCAALVAQRTYGRHVRYYGSISSSVHKGNPTSLILKP